MDFQLKYEIDEDLLTLKDTWKRFSFDTEKLEILFNAMIFKYADKIEGFSQNLEVISHYDNNIKYGEALRYNIETIIKRLEIIKNQGYNTDGLREYYLKEGVAGIEATMDFNEARKYFWDNAGMGRYEKNEVLNKIDEIEDICLSLEPKWDKWNRLRPYVVWASGKDADTALRILSLIQRIN